jgi:hypothetical protein
MDAITIHPQVSLRFRIETDAIGTLEAALAVARRTGAELRNLRAGCGNLGLEVWMRLGAHDADVLALCRIRLQNLIGVADVVEVKDLIDRTAACGRLSEAATLAA